MCITFAIQQEYVMGKTKNISIRFDLDKVGFVMGEEKIEKHQKLVDFLLDKYWWEKKIAFNPVNERNESVFISVNPGLEVEVPKFKNSIEQRIWEEEQRIIKFKNK